MSGDDELERLLREVDASLSGGAKPPATTGPALPAKQSASAPAEPRGRVGTALRTGTVAGVVCGAGVGTMTFFFAWLPFVENPISSGLGAFVGAFLTGTVLGARSRG